MAIVRTRSTAEPAASSGDPTPDASMRTINNGSAKQSSLPGLTSAYGSTVCKSPTGKMNESLTRILVKACASKKAPSSCKATTRPPTSCFETSKHENFCPKSRRSVEADASPRIIFKTDRAMPVIDVCLRKRRVPLLDASSRSRKTPSCEPNLACVGFSRS